MHKYHSFGSLVNTFGSQRHARDVIRSSSKQRQDKRTHQTKPNHTGLYESRHAVYLSGMPRCVWIPTTTTTKTIAGECKGIHHGDAIERDATDEDTAPGQCVRGRSFLPSRLVSSRLGERNTAYFLPEDSSGRLRKVTATLHIDYQ
eukprot:jgi/Psemu1/22568/gm1.22568_g